MNNKKTFPSKLLASLKFIFCGICPWKNNRPSSWKILHILTQDLRALLHAGSLKMICIRMFVEVELCFFVENITHKKILMYCYWCNGLEIFLKIACQNHVYIACIIIKTFSVSSGKEHRWTTNPESQAMLKLSLSFSHTTANIYKLQNSLHESFWESDMTQTMIHFHACLIQIKFVNLNIWVESLVFKTACEI